MNWIHRLKQAAPVVRQKKVVLIGLGLMAVAIMTLLWPHQQDAATAYYEVKRDNFTVTVLDRGTLAAVSEISIRNEVEGTARIIYIVPEGSFVRKGDLLVELDSSQAQDQVNLQQINYEKARFALAQAEAQLDIQMSTTNSDIRAAQLKVTFAKMDLDKFDEGQSMVDLIEASNKVVQAQAQLAVNRENFIWTTNLASKGYETKQKVDVDRLAVMNNENSLIVASNTMLMLQKFDLPKARQKFLSDFEEARKELERVIAQSERRIAQFQADLLSQSNTLVLNEKKLQRDRKNLKSTRVEAPQDGLVVYAMTENRFSSESLIEEGAVVRNRQELIKLPDTSRMKVTIKVHESHIGLVQVNQPAYVKLDSMPDQRFAGVVQKVALLPDSQSRFGNPNLKVYNTEVVITDPLPGVKPGVSAQAEIMITNISGALSVPLQAVTTLKGRQVVYTQRGSRTTPVPIQVGMFNTKFIEITSGLKAGERVLLSPPFDAQEKDIEGAILTAEDKAKAATNNPNRTLTAKPPGSAPGTNLAAIGPRPPERDGSGPAGRLADQEGTADPGLASQGGRRARGETSGRPSQGPGPMRGVDDQASGERTIPGERGGIALAERPQGVADRSGNGAGNPSGAQPRGDESGQLSQGDRNGADPDRAGRGSRGPRPNREEMMKRFDKDGDGQLNEQEMATMRESFAAAGGRTRRPARGDGPPGGPGAVTIGPSNSVERAPVE